MAEPRPNPREPAFRIWIRRTDPPEGPVAIRYDMSEGKGILRQSRPGVVLDSPARPQGLERALTGAQVRAARFLHVWGKGAFRQGYLLNRITDADLARLPDDDWVELNVVRDASQNWLVVPATLAQRPRPMLRRDGADPTTLVSPIETSGEHPTLPPAQRRMALRRALGEPQPFRVDTARTDPSGGADPAAWRLDSPTMSPPERARAFEPEMLARRPAGLPDPDDMEREVSEAPDDSAEDIVPIGEADDDDLEGALDMAGGGAQVSAAGARHAMSVADVAHVAGMAEEGEIARMGDAHDAMGDGEAFVFDEMEGTPEPMPTPSITRTDPGGRAPRPYYHGNNVTDAVIDFGSLDPDTNPAPDVPDNNHVVRRLESELRLARDRIRVLEGELARLQAQLGVRASG